MQHATLKSAASSTKKSSHRPFKVHPTQYKTYACNLWALAAEWKQLSRLLLNLIAFQPAALGALFASKQHFTLAFISCKFFKPTKLCSQIVSTQVVLNCCLASFHFAISLDTYTSHWNDSPQLVRSGLFVSCMDKWVKGTSEWIDQTEEGAWFLWSTKGGKEARVERQGELWQQRSKKIRCDGPWPPKKAHSSCCSIKANDLN